jgi:hypothetical protein
MKNPVDHIGNRTHDLPACGAVPQPNAPRRTPVVVVVVVVVVVMIMFIKRSANFDGHWPTEILFLELSLRHHVLTRLMVLLEEPETLRRLSS